MGDVFSGLQVRPAFLLRAHDFRSQTFRSHFPAAMKLCPYCARPLEDAAVVCIRCKTPLANGAEQAQQRRAVARSAAVSRLGVTYAATTGGLLMTIGLSSWCWSKSENETLHTACIGLWALAGLLLTVSQLVFIVLGVKAKGSGTRLAVLTVALILLGLIGLFVFALANMPS